LQVNKDNKYREAHLSISFKKFMISPPPDRTIKKDGDDLRNINLWGIMAKEYDPPEGKDPISWLLVTNIKVSTLEAAIEKLSWYTKRWDIEIFHKILKSGCAIESAQLRNRERLINFITIKSIIAWRIFWLTRCFNTGEVTSSNEILTNLEQKLLWNKFNRNKKFPKNQLSVKEAIKLIAKLGGYIGRNTDPPPGIISLWRGWTKLMSMVDGYNILTGKDICG
jgi:hypothetical protein